MIVDKYKILQILPTERAAAGRAHVVTRVPAGGGSGKFRFAWRALGSASVQTKKRDHVRKMAYL